MPRGVTPLLASLLVLVGIPASAEEPAAVTAISDVRASRLTSGASGLVGYKATHSFNAPVSPPVSLPGTRIDRSAHATAFDGMNGDAAMLAAWMAPNNMVQFTPASGLYESAYYTSAMPEKDSFGSTIGVPVAAGDRFELGIANVANDTVLDWSAAREIPSRGTLAWDVATDTRHLESSKGGGEGEVDVMFFRADMVARGGDVDARQRAVTAPPLVIDLPTTYPGQALGGYFHSVQWPHTHYVGGVEMRVLPSIGKAVIQGSVKGYLPQAREVTLPNGKSVKEWHIMVTGMIVVSPEDNPAMAPRTAFVPTGDSRVVVGDLTGKERTLELGSGDTLITGPDMGLGRVLPTGAAGATDASQLEGEPIGAGVRSPAAELKEAAQVTAASISQPRELTFGRGAYRATLDHDFRGTGTLALRDVTRGRTGRKYVEAIGVPYVRLGGQPVKLSRDRLLDLRVSSQYRWVGLQNTGWGTTHTRPTSFARTSRTAAHKPGMVIDAIYDVGEGRYAFVTFEGFPERDVPMIEARAIIRTLTGHAVVGSPIEYLELPDPGPVTYQGQERDTEFQAPLDLNGEHKTLEVGMRDVSASIITTGSDGEMTVVRGGGAPVGTPAPGAASLVGAPVGIYYAPQAGNEARFAASTVRVALAREPAIQPSPPKPLGTPCGTPQISEPQADAPPAFDVREAWLDSDGVGMYVTLRVADLPASAPNGVDYSYGFHWRTEHSAWFARAVLTGSTWRYEWGWNNTDAVVSTYTPTAPTTGEVRTGADGLIRIAIPEAAIEGDVIRDTSSRAGAGTATTTQSADIAPNGSGWQQGLGGDYRFGTCS